MHVILRALAEEEKMVKFVNNLSKRQVLISTNVIAKSLLCGTLCVLQTILINPFS